MNHDQRKRVLVIGSNGLVGTELSKAYCDEYEIQSVHRGNIQSLPELLLEEYDTLVFLAQSPHYKAPSFPEDLTSVNIELLRRALELSIDKVKHVICFSSGDVYKRTDAVLLEDSEIDFLSSNPYKVSKIAGEMIARTFHTYFDAISIVRPFFIFGRNQKKQMLFSRLINQIKLGEPIQIGRDGGLLCNPIFVRDAVRKVAGIIENHQRGVNYFNIFGSETVLLFDLIQTMGRTLGIAPHVVKTDTPLVRIVAATKTPIDRCQYSLKEAFEDMLHAER